MKRHPALIELSRDHHKGLLLAQSMKKDAPAYRGMPTDNAGKCSNFLAEFGEKLKPHFEEEEKILFPFVSEKDHELKKVSEELIAEHRAIESFVSKLNPENPDTEVMDRLGHTLEKHIRTEERVLFEQIQEKLDERSLEQLGKMLDRENKGGAC